VLVRVNSTSSKLAAVAASANAIANNVDEQPAYTRHDHPNGDGTLVQ
jgi:hypothetical protein